MIEMSDPELKVMKRMLSLLGTLPEDGRRRVVSWLVDRLKGDSVYISKPAATQPESASGMRKNGGIARARNLSPERRSEIARKAAVTRWGEN
jgi:hypothetical protein